MSEPLSLSRWQLWVSATGVGLVVLGSLGGLYLMSNEAYTKAAALEKRVESLERVSAARDIQLKVICTDLTEVETQFRASDQVRNLMHVDSLRIEAMLWHKSFNAEFPVGNAYLPTIAQDHPTPCV